MATKKQTPHAAKTTSVDAPQPSTSIGWLTVANLEQLFEDVNSMLSDLKEVIEAEE